MSTNTVVLTSEPRPEPGPRRQIIPSGVAGMFLFVFSESMLFAGLISAHTVVRAQAAAQAWPPPGQPRLPLAETAINTGALLLSGVILILAHAWFKKEPGRAVAPFAISILLGAFFVVFQGMEWVALIGEGLTLSSSVYGSFFYVIVGAHAIHAAGALAGMVWAWVRLQRGRLSASEFQTVQVFWYFVVLVWPVLYLKIYL